MNAKKLAIALVLLTLVTAVKSHAQHSQRDTSLVAAIAVRALHPPVLDGADTDDVWRAAARIKGFRMIDPIEDGEPAFATEARIAYDQSNLYVFVRAFDPRPDSIVGLLSRRDVNSASDQIRVMIDSYHDRRTGYTFAVNPAGVKRDVYTYDDGTDDTSWDAVWDVATITDSLGWTAEFRIPLSQLRYAPAAEHQFGVMIVREVARRNEKYSWPVSRRSLPGLISKFAVVGGFAGLSSPRRIEVSPYALTRNQGAARTNGFAREQRASIGGDLKYGITSNLTVDATVNPDFGQVEADPATLNLTSFETFLSERRPFFLEGTGIFEFGDDPTGVFYSRRIGRAPQLSGLVTDANADVPGASRILGAGKLTGRLLDGTSLGIIGAVTERAAVGSVNIEPATTYGVVRATHDFREGDSAVGIVATTVHRNLDASTGNYLRSDAVTAGIDGRHRFAGGHYSLHGSLVASTVRGTTRSITSTQRSGVHLYQRADDDLAVDTTRTSLDGRSLSLTATKISGLLRGGMIYQYITPGFESNDLGFLARADMQALNLQVALVPSNPVWGWRNAQAVLNSSDQFTAAGLRNGSTIEAVVSGYRSNGARVSVDSWVDNAIATYCDRCARGGPAVRLSPSYNTLVNLGGDPRRRLSPSLGAIYTVADEGRSSLWRVRPYINYRPSTRVSAELGTRFQRNHDNTQYLGSAGPAYLFAQLQQDLLSFTSRLDVTVKPTLSLQLYAEPFVTAGHYTNVRELADARAVSYGARFRPYAGTPPDADFNDKSFNASAVLRWEFRAASTLFIVWTQSREQGDRSLGSFEARRDYGDLFATHPDNVFLVKASYWIGR